MTSFGKTKQLLALTLGIAAVSGCSLRTCGPCDVRIRDADEYRGVFVATAWNLDWPSEPTLSATKMQNEINDIVQQTEESNCNVIFLQVRAFADRIHRSNAAQLEPWSASVGGADPGFDPLRVWIEVCHNHRIKLHFWVNPFRAYAGRFPATKYPTVVDPKTGWTYLDSTKPAVQTYVLGVIEELLSLDDGLIFDHYYPPVGPRMMMSRPSGESTPRKAFKRKKPHTPEPRHMHLDDFIKEVSKKAHDHGKKFGFSPEPDDPNALEWAKRGYLDYVVPEIYDPIGIGHAFEDALDPWLDPSVHGCVIAGLNSIKVHPDEGNWPAAEILAQIKKAREYRPNTPNARRAAGQAHYRQFALRPLPPGTPNGHDLGRELTRPSANNDRYPNRANVPTTCP
jgi:uncharacterized lipoprotein YddW (UPF0748 family)